MPTNLLPGASPVDVSPISPDAQFARVDQGVDFSQAEPYGAIGAGTITSAGPARFVAPGAFGAYAVFEHLDAPIHVGGSSYSDVYYAEEQPLVSKGQRVAAGAPILAAGAAELGFAPGGQVPPLVGGVGQNTQATQPGEDFRTEVNLLSGGLIGPGTVAGISNAGPATAIQGALPGASTAAVGVTGQVARALIRVLEFLAGAFLIWLGIKTFGKAVLTPAVAAVKLV